MTLVLEKMRSQTGCTVHQLGGKGSNEDGWLANIFFFFLPCDIGLYLTLGTPFINKTSSKFNIKLYHIYNYINGQIKTVSLWTDAEVWKSVSEVQNWLKEVIGGQVLVDIKIEIKTGLVETLFSKQADGQN